MQHLNTLWQALSVASAVTELARHSQTYHFGVSSPVTVYLRATSAEARITRWSQPKVEVTAQLQASFGWRVATDQDDAGVYIVAHRRPVVGGLSSAVFHLFVPHDAYLLLRLDAGRVVLEQVDGTLQIAPPDARQHIEIHPLA